GGAALDRNEPGRETAGLAPHHPVGRCLAFQPLCGARRRGRRRTGRSLVVRRVRQAPNIAIAALWVDLLNEAGIAASVQRQFLGSVAGEIPPDQCLPEIWVTHDEQHGPAQALLEQLL